MPKHMARHMRPIMKNKFTGFILFCLSLAMTTVCAEEQADTDQDNTVEQTDEVEQAEKTGEDDEQASVAEQLKPLLLQQLALIDTIEQEQGPQNLLLSEGLLTLGKIYQLSDMHREALRAYQRALYVRRVNVGLYDQGHVRILSAQIESAAALKDWREVDNLYQHVAFIYRRNLDRFDPKWLPVLKTLYSWHINATYLNTGQTAEIHEYEAYSIRQHGEAIITMSDKAHIKECKWLYRDCCADSEEGTISACYE